MSTDPARFSRIADLFDLVEKLPPESWSSAIDELAPDDPGIRAEVLELLQIRRAETGDTFLERARAATKETTTPDVIGPYRIVRELGSGGMGIVYLAEQTAPVQRSVAIKVIKLGMDSQAVLARFERERQALARMASDHIARVFDAGITDEGRPFFVMEYVDGVPLSLFCDEHRLSLVDRIALFRQLCDGVQHAHQKGVIHRDIKPGNALVTVASGTPTVKIIDFGIARAVATGDAAAATLTLQGQLIGTLEYMSPEQAVSGSEQVDVRSDVYSLGVVLYELLAGDLPFPTAELRQRGYSEAQRILRDVDPPAPSRRIATHGDAAIADRRQLLPTTLSRRVRGDLDWITMRALEKDPRRRYGSAQEIAADLDRYLRSEPVSAGPPSATYRLGKFLRRHRTATGATAVVVVAAALALGLTVSARHAQTLEREQHHGTLRQQVATLVARLDALPIQERWPTRAMIDASSELEATVRRAATADDASDPAFAAELASWQEVAESWRQDTAFFVRLGDSLLVPRYGSEHAHRRRQWQQNLDALRLLGIELCGPSDTEWVRRSATRIAASRLPGLALLAVRNVRNCSSDGDDPQALERATALLEATTTGDARTLHLGNWSAQNPPPRDVVLRLVAALDDPVDVMHLVPAMEEVGFAREAKAVLAKFSLSHPASPFVVLLQTKSAWREALDGAADLQTAAIAALPRLEPMTQALQTTGPDLPMAWSYRTRLLTAAGDPRVEAAAAAALARFPDEPVTMWALAQYLQANARPDEARALLARVVALEPAFVEAEELLIAAAPAEQRLELLRRANAADPWHLGIAMQLGNELLATGAWSECIAALAPVIGDRSSWRTATIYPPLERAANGAGRTRLAATARRAASFFSPATAVEASATTAEPAVDVADAATTFDRATKLVAATAKDIADVDPTAWQVLEQATAQLREQCATDPLDTFLQAQLWQAMPPWRSLFAIVDGKQRRQETLTEPETRAARVFTPLIDLRNATRPTARPTR